MGDHQEANVMVFVGIFDHLALCVVAGRDVVDVDIKWHDYAINGHDVEVCNARLFAGFAKGDLFDVPRAVGVAAELEPTVKLSMVCEERPPAIGRKNPRRASNMARTARTVEAVCVVPRVACGPAGGELE
jgi:hypothetical protein